MSDSFSLPNLTFTCPRCQVICKHQPLPIIEEIFPNERVRDLISPFEKNKEVGLFDFARLFPITAHSITRCPNCNGLSLLVDGELVWPKPSGIPASSYMPEEVLTPYNEAQKILHYSPWGACVLLRIALERLCCHLGQTQGTLYSRIEQLNLTASEKKIWTAIREVGNASAHENAEFLNSYQSNTDPNIAIVLSRFLNQLVESHISAVCEAEEIQNLLKKK